MMDAKSVGSPVDGRINVGEPGFAQDEVIFLERVDDRVDSGGVLLTLEGDVSGVGRKGLMTIWKNDRDGRGRLHRDVVLFDEGGRDHIALSASIDKDPSRVTVDIADESKQGGRCLVNRERMKTQAFLVTQTTGFALGDSRVRHRDTRRFKDRYRLGCGTRYRG